jgi:iron only hydrogenase large subunit-like protein
MKILDFVPANCKNCYKCVRNCSVKAIKMVDDHAQIVEERCVACGTCFLVCPQNARNILSDLDNVIKALKQNKKVVISIAPSYLGIFKEPYRLIGALKKFGVHAIEETSIGAAKITELYREYIKNADGKNMITTACPSVNLMVQTYFPELIENLMPIDSPMIAHSKMLRKKYGKDAYITFLGPCIAKKCEAYPYQVAGIIDAVISFEEIEEYLIKNDIKLEDCEEVFPDAAGSVTGQRYPIEKGILAGLSDVLSDKQYTSIAVAGSKSCKNLFEALKESKLSNICIEANMCEGACMGGPAISKQDGNSYVRQVLIRNRIKKNEQEGKSSKDTNYDIDYVRKFRDKSVKTINYTEEQIQEVLKNIGKHSKSDELNCGSCGYETCRDKAISVLNGLSHPEMCLPYMRNKAERISNISFEYSPNILFIVDENLNMLELNPRAEEAFNAKIANFKGQNLSLLIPVADYKAVIESGCDLVGKKVFLDKYGIVAYSSIIYLPKLKIIFGILIDITDEERKKEKLLNFKLNTIESADKVIEKQMRVAQEIAGLLGETTAETKITLLKLKKIVADEESEV